MTYPYQKSNMKSDAMHIKNGHNSGWIENCIITRFYYAIDTLGVKRVVTKGK